MGQRYQHLMFGDKALDRQEHAGSIVAYGAGLQTPDEGPQSVDEREIRFFTEAFQFHLSTIGPTGWPYIQYRSGPRGFVKHLGGNRFGFADVHGNQQFVSVGNIEADNRVALFLADFPRRRRIKAFGRAEVIEAETDPDLLAQLCDFGDHRLTTAERSIIIDIEAFDWNCARSLIPQYTADEVRERTQPYIDEIARLQARVAELEAAQ